MSWAVYPRAMTQVFVGRKPYSSRIGAETKYGDMIIMEPQEEPIGITITREKGILLDTMHQD